MSPAPSLGYDRLRHRRRWSGVFIQACLVLLSLAVGRAIVETQALDVGALEIVLAAVGVMAGLAVMLWGPVACIAAISVLTVLRLLPQVSVGGGVDLSAADAFFGALVCWWAIGFAGVGRQRAQAGARASFSGAPVLLFLGYAGLTLLYVAAVDADRLPVSLVSWLRLIETAAIGWLAASFLRTRRDVTVVLIAIAAAGCVDVILALAAGAGEEAGGPLGVRGGGVVNPNELGLLSGLLILMAAFGALGRSPLHRVPLGVVGALGLAQSQSVGSVVGTSVALVLGLAFMVAPSSRIVSATAVRAGVALALAIGVAYGLATVIRPANVPTSSSFGESSARQRSVLAVAGLELAERNPVIGVGWRRSEVPEVIGDPGLNTELRARFNTTKSEFFPDVSPSSVHNAYVQVVADLGLVGLGLFLFMLVSLGRGVKRVLERVPRASPSWPALWFMAWALVLILVWWNDNPLYGGQVETAAPALFLGAIAGLRAAGTVPREVTRR